LFDLIADVRAAIAAFLLRYVFRYLISIVVKRTARLLFEADLRHSM
jgi:hypothetical protein